MQAPLSTSPLPPLGLTSPLVIPNAPVGHTGVPLGAPELATAGVTPTTSGASPMLGATCVSSTPPSAAMGSSTTGTSPNMGSPVTGASAGMGGSVTGTSGSGAAPFDVGGMAASAPGACAASA